jgi:23S rRNA pseudouridine1911/1915/1917 synthase
MMVRATGAASSTEYTVLARATGAGTGVSVLRCRLGTGRTHQIRVHLADRGWPLVGDPTYGSAPRRRLGAPDLDRLVRGFPRQALHAWRLTVRLPSSGVRESFVAPLPDDLAALLRALGLGRFAGAATADR